MDQRGLADLTWDARNDDGSPRAASHRLLVFPRSLVPLYYLGFRRLWAGRGITGRRGPSARGVARRGLSARRRGRFPVLDLLGLSLAPSPPSRSRLSGHRDLPAAFCDLRSRTRDTERFVVVDDARGTCEMVSFARDDGNEPVRKIATQFAPARLCGFGLRRITRSYVVRASVARQAISALQVFVLLPLPLFLFRFCG